MQGAKRQRRDADEPCINIKVSDTETLVNVRKAAVVAASRLAHSLELADGATWDVTGFLVEGKPFTMPTVVAWVNSVYSAIDGCDFEEQSGQEEEGVSAEDLFAQLTFADAVDSGGGIVKAVVGNLDRIYVRLAFKNAPDSNVKLFLDGRVPSWGIWGPHPVINDAIAIGGLPEVLPADDEAQYEAEEDAELAAAFSAKMQYVHSQPNATGLGVGAGTATEYSSTGYLTMTGHGEKAAAAAARQVCAQLELLLLIAARMTLPDLAARVHDFVTAALQRAFLLKPHLPLIFTQSVVKERAGTDVLAALAASTAEAASQQLLLLHGPSRAIRLEPRAAADGAVSARAGASVAIKAVLERPLMGSPAGTEMGGSVNLQDGTLKLGDVTYPLAVALGPR